ncbi:polysaccharide lyase family 8 super-sandwich domain-containing protein [Pedobacter sp. SYP-B3415]|uniref:polysaccharide lyase family 8 super-sandwich domain-containing protein n=1 Tax=Pedobacter sp. SYP-B3415 TaxID=2496641 RepID=UPI001F0DD01D|nr:polysaccharide lyase family 8 super-sandwich domain-containing protein [Pedobacter sp. SYP-B3415]
MLLFFSCITATQAGQPDADSVLNRHRRYLISAGKAGDQKILMQTFDSQKRQWAGIDYNDNSVASWQPLKHLKNVFALALAWSVTKSDRERSELKRVADAALSHWYKHRYRSTNWWYNEIAVPQVMADVIILMRCGWTETQKEDALSILGQHRVAGTGANLVWTAALGLYHGALTGNHAKADRAAALLQNEVRMGTGDGVQPDYSFLQHGARLQMAHYGAAFLADNLRLAWELRATRWAYPQEKTDILAQTMLQGWQWMARGIHVPPGVVDRAVSRPNSLRSGDLRFIVPFAIEAAPQYKSELRGFAAQQNAPGVLRGFKHFPYADFSVYHHQDFSFFLKTISTRTLPAESINGENLQGQLLNSGDGYLVSNGNEYFNLMPVWNWNMLPGITTFAGAEVIGRPKFSGAVSSGASGLVALDLSLTSKDNREQLTGHKVWAMHGKMVVCLIANLNFINARPDYPVSVLDQARLSGNITVSKPAGTRSGNMQTYRGLKWIHHNKFAYLPLGSEPVSIYAGPVSGSWSQVNSSERTDTITDQIFRPVIYHKASSFSGYVICFADTPADAAALAKSSPWKLHNTADCQAVTFEDGTVMSAFFAGGSLKLPHKTLSVNRPCLLIIQNNNLFVSDPTHTGGPVVIKYNQKIFNITLPGDGTTAMSRGI